MDEKFILFEKWYLNRKEIWKQHGIVVDEAGLSQYGHQYWIKLHSENGLANIALYESNGYYWVDFEGGNYDYDVMFQRFGIEFDNAEELELYEAELMHHITWNGDDA